MPHVPDTVPGKRVPGAGARTEGRGQPSNIRGGSRMQESCTYGSVRGAPSNGRPYRNRENGYPSESSGFVYLPETVRVSSKDLPTSGTEVSNPLPSSGESHKLEQQHDLRGRTASGGGHPWRRPANEGAWTAGKNASRETDRLGAELIRLHPELKLTKVVVSEAGASVYSASAFASQELPGLDVSLCQFPAYQSRAHARAIGRFSARGPKVPTPP